MRQKLSFHPEWGCLAPAPSLLRTIHTVLVATAVGATAGGGVVLSLVGYSAGQTSVAERTLVRPIPAVSASVSAPQTRQLPADTLNVGETTQVSLSDSQADNSATTATRSNSPAHPAEASSTPEGASKTAVAPSPAQKHSTHVAQRARHSDTARQSDAIRSSQQQQALARQTGPNVVQRFFAGLTAAIEQYGHLREGQPTGRLAHTVQTSPQIYLKEHQS